MGDIPQELEDALVDFIDSRVEAGGGGGEPQAAWEDVTRHFLLRYRSRKDGVYLGKSDDTYRPGPAFSIAAVRTPFGVFLDGYVRFGSDCERFRNTLDTGSLSDGWELHCTEPSWWPSVGGNGLCYLWAQGKGPNTTPICAWEQKPDGTWALVPRMTPLDFSAGIFSWNYPWTSGHSIWVMPGTHFRVIIGPYRTLGGA
jgi:hypothetical protein